MDEMIASPKFWGCLVCFVGIILTFVAVIIAMVRRNKKKYYTGVTEGTVVENRMISESRSDSDGSYTHYNSYYAVVKYEVNGSEYTLMSNIHASKPVYTIGERVKIGYNPQKPEKFFIEREQYIEKRLQYIFTAVGIGVFLMGLLFIFIFSKVK